MVLVIFLTHFVTTASLQRFQYRLQAAVQLKQEPRMSNGFFKEPVRCTSALS